MSLPNSWSGFPDDRAAERWFEAQRWPDGPVCPDCGSCEYGRSTIRPVSGLPAPLLGPQGHDHAVQQARLSRLGTRDLPVQLGAEGDLERPAGGVDRRPAADRLVQAPPDPRGVPDRGREAARHRRGRRDLRGREAAEPPRLAAAASPRRPANRQADRSRGGAARRRCGGRDGRRERHQHPDAARRTAHRVRVHGLHGRSRWLQRPPHELPAPHRQSLAPPVRPARHPHSHQHDRVALVDAQAVLHGRPPLVEPQAHAALPQRGCGIGNW